MRALPMLLILAALGLFWLGVGFLFVKAVGWQALGILAAAVIVFGLIRGVSDMLDSGRRPH